MNRRRIIRLEARAAARPDPKVEAFVERQLAWSIAMMFRLFPAQRSGEGRDAYEARTFGTTTRRWKRLCRAAGPDSDLVRNRNAYRKIDKKPGDRDHEMAVLSDVSEGLEREIEIIL